ncbi:hypothetical protein [Pedobacter sp. SL55]|uniref:hypothetical protein n=1 Tax=Pedobacter sp. SL55 TaxID=2995161 RepID=UPI002270489E|nr:hypothetical protein [Pedobacter sp. SL55]WAC40325.1 hypothetical protein OVA16_17390 [Pedobacter sp. SL55]
MTLKKVNETDWALAFQKGFHSIFFDPKYLNVVKDAFGYELNYYTFVKGNKLLFAAAMFSKNGNIVVPYAFTYNSIYFDQAVGDIVYIQIFEDFIELLKKDFKNLSLRLPPNITDIRPFKWSGFEITNSYTYIKDPTAKIKHKLLKKVSITDKNLTFVEEEISEANLTQHLHACFRYGLSKNYYEDYKELFLGLANKKYLKLLSLYKSDSLVTAQIALVDSSIKTLYTLFFNDFGNNTYVGSLNLATFNWCVENGITQVDMVGANDKGIANFKYSFNAQLTPYFSVSYNRNKFLLKTALQKAKGYLKKILKR